MDYIKGVYRGYIGTMEKKKKSYHSGMLGAHGRMEQWREVALSQ